MDDARRWQWLEFVNRYSNRPQFASLESLWRKRAGKTDKSAGDQNERVEWARTVVTTRFGLIAEVRPVHVVVTEKEGVGEMEKPCLEYAI